MATDEVPRNVRVLRILADGRWKGQHGIGRYATEVIPRLRRSGVSVDELGGLSLLHPLEPFWISREVSRHKPDVYYSPGFNPPLYANIPFVFTVHDLVHRRFAQDYGLKQRAYYGAVVKPAIKRASAVITDSEFSKGEILSWVSIPESKVHVVSLGVGGQFGTEAEPLSLAYEYLLYVGNRKSHKNVSRLLEAFGRAALDPDMRLVFSGAADHETAKLANDLGLDKRIVFFGEATEEQLAGLYQGAIALVLPSLLEGFGLPALEAMACGTPVVASSSSSIPEVVGDAAILFDPNYVQDLANAMQQVASDNRLRTEMISKGLERARLFSWERTAEQVLSILRDVAR